MSVRANCDANLDALRETIRSKEAESERLEEPKTAKGRKKRKDNTMVDENRSCPRDSGT
ncbi:hypothetical protein LINPERHAP2_LOCUS29701, partial [Linum perenne]